MRGTVKWFNPKKRYGFIEPEEGGEDVFVHASESEENLSEGDEVDFETEETEKGLQAKEVEKVSSDE